MRATKFLCTLISLLFITNMNASEALNCNEQGLQNGKKDEAGNKHSVSLDCYAEAVENSTSKQVSQNRELELSAIGHRSMIFVKKSDQKAGIIAGVKTGIKEVVATAFNQTGEFLAIINKLSNADREILIFSATSMGNVHPYRKIQMEELGAASAISFLDDKVLVVAGDGKSILGVSMQADSRSPSNKEQIAFESFYSASDKVKFLKQIATGETLIVDENAKMISLDASGGVNWNMNLASLGIAELANFSYKDDQVTLRDENGSVRVFTKPTAN